MSRPSLFFLLALLLIGSSLVVQEPDADQQLEGERLRLQNTIDIADQGLQENALRWARALDSLGGAEWMVRYGTTLEEQQGHDGLILLGFINDSLVCWSGQAGIALNDLRDQNSAHLRYAMAAHGQAPSCSSCS